MVPLRFRKDGRFYHLNKDEFRSNILTLCEQHKEEKRALCFCFLFHDYSNPQIFKVLGDDNYWNALHKISGQFLSIFYIATEENTFGEDLIESDGMEQRGLYGLNSEENFDQAIKPMLKKYFDIEDPIKMPSLIFFQADGKAVIDYFAIELNEERIEDSFLELKQYIKSAIAPLENILPENIENSQAVFNLLKDGVSGTQLKRKIFKATQAFPMNLFLGWLTSKV